jgi:hypothetical protein
MRQIAQPHFPKVAVVSEVSPSASNSASLTIAGLFSDWPKDRLFPVFATGEFDDTFAPQYLRLHPWFWNFPAALLRKLPRAIVVRSREIPGNVSRQSDGKEESPFPGLREIRALCEVFPQLQTRATLNFLADVGVEVIYSPLGSIRIANLVSVVSRRLKIPTVPHFFDDWPSTLYSRGLLATLPRRMLKVQLQSVLAVSPIGLGIGPEMANDFQTRFKRPFQWLMRPLSPDDCTFASATCHAEFDLVYVGGLHLNRWKALIDIAIAADQIGASLAIFSPKTDLRDFGTGLRRFRNVALSSVDPENVVPTLQRGGVAIHVESRGREVSRFTRLSVSTKLPQCLASGRPILAYGPAHLASMRLVERSQAGIVVDTSERLASVISNLLNDSALRMKLSKNGQSYANSHFSQSVTLNRLCDVLQSAIHEAKGVARSLSSVRPL